jgi:hypothetical protein
LCAPQTSKLVPSAQPKFRFDPSVFHSLPPFAPSNLSAGPSPSSAPIPSTRSSDTPRYAQWRRKETLVRSRDLNRPSLFCPPSTRRSRSLLLLRAPSTPPSMLCESRLKKRKRTEQERKLIQRARSVWIAMSSSVILFNKYILDEKKLNFRESHS